MQKFNQMTEEQMSQVDGGIALALIGAFCGIICAISSIVGTTFTVYNSVKSK